MNTYNDYLNYLNIYNYPNNNYDILNSKEGFEKGNMFNNLYDPYKNYKIKTINTNNLLNKIQELQFSLIEYNLYLDIYPNDNNIINLYNNTLTTLNEYIYQYETTYGPLNIDTINKTNYWQWANSSWPWEVNK